MSYLGPKSPSERPNLNYAIWHPKSGAEIWPREKSWAYEEAVHKKHIEEGRLWWGKDFSYSEPRLKKYFSEMNQGMVPKSMLKYKDVGGTSNGRDNLRKIFGNEQGAIFDNPKPYTLLIHLLKLGSNNNDLIMDFFAGSSTTAHAIIQLNAEDGGHRKFIMVQLPEACDEKSEAFKAGYKTIADISKERIRRAGKKLKEENTTSTPDLDTGFRVLKVDSSNMADVYYTPDAVEQSELNLQTDNIKEDRTSEDLLFQVLLDWGVDLTLPIVRESIEGREVFLVDDNALAACFETGGKITEGFCKELTGCRPLRVVFRDSGFASDDVKINVEQIFKLKSPHTDIKTI